MLEREGPGSGRSRVEYWKERGRVCIRKGLERLGSDRGSIRIRRDKDRVLTRLRYARVR